MPLTSPDGSSSSSSSSTWTNYTNAISLAPHLFARTTMLQDNLMPLTCQGQNWQGGLALTLVDSLDTLALMNRCGLKGAWQGVITMMSML
jgi:hypothetical protein